MIHNTIHWVFGHIAAFFLILSPFMPVPPPNPLEVIQSLPLIQVATSTPEGVPIKHSRPSADGVILAQVPVPPVYDFNSAGSVGSKDEPAPVTMVIPKYMEKEYPIVGKTVGGQDVYYGTGYFIINDEGCHVAVMRSAGNFKATGVITYCPKL